MAQTATTSSEPTFMPRPDCFEIGPGVYGQGAIATKAIFVGTIFKTHVYTDCPHTRKEFPDGWVRHSIGAWYNQAGTPDQVNCKTIHRDAEGNILTGDRIYNPVAGDTKELVITRDIASGEELCVEAYTLYDPVAPD